MEHRDRVLVVDDDPALRSLLCDYLTDVGFDVDLAADGRQMRDALSRARPDVIVMDLMLPGSDGLTLLRRIFGARQCQIHSLLQRRHAPIGQLLELIVDSLDIQPRPSVSIERFIVDLQKSQERRMIRRQRLCYQTQLSHCSRPILKHQMEFRQQQRVHALLIVKVAQQFKCPTAQVGSIGDGS